MRLLLDACVDKRLCAALNTLGVDTSHVLDWNPSVSDAELIAHAFQAKLVLVTHDKDFSQHAHYGTNPYGGILRIAPDSIEAMQSICLQAIQSHGPSLLSGHVVIATKGRMRLIRPWSGG